MKLGRKGKKSLDFRGLGKRLTIAPTAVWEAQEVATGEDRELTARQYLGKNIICELGEVLVIFGFSEVHLILGFGKVQ